VVRDVETRKWLRAMMRALDRYLGEAREALKDTRRSELKMQRL
jgi:hypothetical protein